MSDILNEVSPETKGDLNMIHELLFDDFNIYLTLPIKLKKIT
tara:strand:- start:150 stop:275 length:126 start_codon:yes stop_codon:yes gene_type:complete